MINEAFDFQTLVIVLFKYRRRALAVFLLCVGLAIAASLLIGKQYAARTSVLVKLGRELVYQPTSGGAAPLPAIDKDAVMASNIAIMQSAPIEEEVIQRIGLARLYPDIAGVSQEPGLIPPWVGEAISSLREALGMTAETPMRQALLRFNKRLSVEIVKKTGILDVTFMHPDPDIAAEVANLVVSLFQERVGGIFDNPNLKFEEEQVNAERAALQMAETKLNAYRGEHNVYALADQIGLLLKQKIDLDSKLKDTSAQIVQLQGLTATIAAQSAVTPKTVPLYSETERHKTVDDTETQLLQLRLQEQQMRGRFNDTYPPLVDLRNQIRLAEGTLRRQSGDVASHSRTGVNDLRTQLDQSLLQNQAQLRALSGTRQTIEAQVGAIDAAVAELSRTQPELAALEHDVELRHSAVRTSYDKLVEARAIDGLNHEKPGSFSVYEAATPPDLADPARPRPLLYTLAGVIAGLLGAALTVFLSWRMFRGFLTPKQAAYTLDRPVLAVVDYNRRLAGWSRGRLAGAAIAGSARPTAMVRRPARVVPT